MDEIKKAIIPITEDITGFIPFSRALPAMAWPVIDVPMVQYSIMEAEEAGIEDIIFIASSKKNIISDYFKSPKPFEKLIKEQKTGDTLKELKRIVEIIKNISFSTVIQGKSLGDGYAIIQAAQKISKKPFALILPHQIIESNTSCIAQLINIFKTSQRPVIALTKKTRGGIPSYNTVETEQIAKRVFKIRRIIERPGIERNSSNLSIAGRYILTPDVMDYLKQGGPKKKGQIKLSKTLDKMIQDGKSVYGYEFEGKLLECGTKNDWLKAHLYLSLKDPRYSTQLRKFLKEAKLI